MIKIVIVDDEKMIREGLVNTMPWSRMGTEVVGAAANGQTALEIIREKNPHIILTDIRMPKMDGLQLLKTVKEENPKAKVVILSGYDEFAYAQQAIKYGAADYLIKPVNAEELEKLIKKLSDDFNDEIYEDLSLLRLKKELEEELEQYITAIRIGNRDIAFSVLERLSDIVLERSISTEQLHRIYLEVIDSVIETLKGEGIKLTEKLEKEYLNSFVDLFNFNEQQELKEWIYQFTHKVIELVEEKKGDSYRLVIKKALEYIDKHYNEDLSIQKVAEAVHLSPNYFSHTFKKLREEGFTEYLNKVRIEKAKKMLSENLYKVYEVSDMVGYSDYKYFSSVFKKLVGMSPTQYSEARK